MSEARREIQQPTGYIPKLTALSTAFPLNNDEPEPIRRGDADRGAEPKDTAGVRPPHRHDAGE